MNSLKQYYEQGKLEIGLDEAGRGCLMGPVFTAGVILNDVNSYPPPYEIKDSKKCSPKIRDVLRKYIEDNSIAYCVEMIDTDRPVIFDCQVDQDENCFPMIPSGKPHNQMLLGPKDQKENKITGKGKALV